MAVEVDSLQIKIKADAKTASNAINALRASLVSLSMAVGNGKGMKGLSKLAESLSSLADAKKDVKAFATGVKSMTTTLDNSVKSMNKFNNAVMDTVMMAGTAAGQMRDLGLSTEQLTQTANAAAMLDMTEALNNLSEKMGKTNKNASELNKKVSGVKNAVSSAAKETKKLSKETKTLGSAVNKIKNPLDKLIHSIGRIALYRAIRTAMKTVTQAVKEGLTNLEAWSREVGSEFAPAVDDLRRHILLLKNAFATALRPVIEALIPPIIQLVDWFSKLADFAAQVFSILTGKVDANGRYTKAVLSDLEQSNKQAKELRRTLLGFDEINRLDGDTGSGNDSSANGMFVKADISPEAIAAAAKLQKIIDKIKEIIGKIPWDKVWEIGQILLGVGASSKVFNAVKKVWEAVKGLFGFFLSKKGLVLTAIVASAKWGDVISEKVRKSKEEVNAFFDRMVEISKDSSIATGFANLLRDIFNLFNDTVGWISSAIYKLFHGDLVGAGKDALHFLVSLARNLTHIIIDLVNILLGVINDVVNNILIPIAQFIWNKIIQPLFNKLVLEILNFPIRLRNAGTQIKIWLLQLLGFIIDAINNKLKELEIMVNGVIAILNKMGMNLEPITISIDRSGIDDTIAELEKTKLPTLTEDVDIVPKWTDPGKLKLEISTEGVDRTFDEWDRKIDAIGKKIANYTKTIYDGAGALKPGLGGGNIQAYASGGFPTMGSYFLAGENGPEYVGSINGQTGVWNSDQMAQALYNAVASAMAQYSGGGDIYLDGEVIYRNTVRRNNNQVRSTGRSALLT